MARIAAARPPPVNLPSPRRIMHTPGSAPSLRSPPPLLFFQKGIYRMETSCSTINGPSSPVKLYQQSMGSGIRPPLPPLFDG